MEIDIETPEGIEELKAYLTILEENPQYAAAILETNDDKSFKTPSSIGPLGYTYRSEDTEPSSLKVNITKQEENENFIFLYIYFQPC